MHDMRLLISVFIIILITTPMSAAVLKATYHPAPETDVEHGQGAIERNELPHRPLSDTQWFICVPDPADPAHWQKRLSETVERRFGRFTVETLTPEEQERVDSGEITFQQ